MSMNKCYESKNRFQIMSYDQISRLVKMLTDDLEIVTIDEEIIRNEDLCLKNIIIEMRHSLNVEGIKVEDIRLIGGAATYVIDATADIYSDIDILFCLSNCSSLAQMDRVRTVVMSTLARVLKNKSSILSKQVCIPAGTGEFWSLFSLGTPLGDVIEFKFATDPNQRLHFECSVDAFQITIDPVLCFLDKWSSISRSFYPTTTIECVWGCVKTAVDHLYKRIVHIARPDQLRGGGLLKFCKLLACGFSLDSNLEQHTIQRLMCTRFFIDFPTISDQHRKIVGYLLCHFPRDNHMYISFLENLSRVILTSSSYSEINKVQLGNFIRLLANQIKHQPTITNQNNCITILQSNSSSSTSDNNIRLSEFEDRNKWSVAEITHEPSIPSSSSSNCTDESSSYRHVIQIDLTTDDDDDDDIDDNNNKINNDRNILLLSSKSSYITNLDINSCSCSSSISTPSELSHDCLSEDNV